MVLLCCDIIITGTHCFPQRLDCVGHLFHIWGIITIESQLFRNQGDKYGAFIPQFNQCRVI